MKKALIGTALVIGMIGSAAAATNCSSFPNNVVTGNVNDDVFASGYTCTIAASAFVNGNVLQVGDGDLVIRGIVNGAADETGNGSIIVAKGEVGGNLTEADAGNITIRGGSTIKGSVEEAGIGSVFVTYFMDGPVRGYRVLLRNNDTAYAMFHRRMTDAGFVMYPMTLKRNHISGAHTDDDIDRCVAAFEEDDAVGRQPAALENEQRLGELNTHSGLSGSLVVGRGVLIKVTTSLTTSGVASGGRPQPRQ